MNRINATFSRLKSEGRAGLVTFIMAYDPDFDTSLEILKGLPEAGADIVELGIPFSDPMADGPVIQESGRKALKAGGNLRGVLEMVRQFRKTNKDTPLVLMGYYNPIFAYGTAQFGEDAAKAGVDGIILVDLPPEEEEEFTSVAKDIALIRLIAPTTPPERAKTIAATAKGFVYYIAVRGITGTRSGTDEEIEAAMKSMREHTELPVAVGFGVKTARQAQAIAKFADAVVVGSALVTRVEESSQGGTADAALAFTRELADAIRATEPQTHQPSLAQRAVKTVRRWLKKLEG